MTEIAWPAQLPDRPLRLFTPPEPIEATAPVPDDPPLLFRWRGRVHRIRAATGPERIAAEWWRRTPDPTRPLHDFIRDYYRVEDQQGGRFWVFRIGLVGAPRWFVHGIFG
jgi:protein ImuB